MTTAHEMTAMLRRHYLPEGRPPGGIFAPEIGSPCGKRRADLIWLPTTTGRGSGIVGHEIKVTRSDVLTELADPTKADPWAQFCERWYLVVADPAMVDGLDIPERWGILSPPSGRRTRTMTTLRPAPALRPLEPAPGVTRVATWLMYRNQERISALEYTNRQLTGDLEHVRREAMQRAATGNSRPSSPHEERIRAVVVEAEQLINRNRQSPYVSTEDLSAADVAAAVLDAAKLRAALRNAAWNMQSRLRDFQRLIKPDEYVERDLAALVRDAEAASTAPIELDGAA